jgi:hypothetical protein
MNTTTTTKPAVIIIAKVLHERGMEFDSFELPDRADIRGGAPGDVRLF